MQRIYQFLLFLILIINSVHAQNDTELHEAVGKYFTAYRLSGYSPATRCVPTAVRLTTITAPY